MKCQTRRLKESYKVFFFNLAFHHHKHYEWIRNINAKKGSIVIFLESSINMHLGFEQQQAPQLQVYPVNCKQKASDPNNPKG